MDVSWTVYKAECQRIDAFGLWCWRRLLRLPWMARTSNQFILKEIRPGCSLEGLMLKLKLQYFGHLMRRAESFEKKLVSKRKKSTPRRILSPCLFNLYAKYIMRTLGWKKHKLESRLPGEISITSDMQKTPSYGRKWRQTKKPLDESERGEWKFGLKLKIQKTKIMASSLITSWQMEKQWKQQLTLFSGL